MKRIIDKLPIHWWAYYRYNEPWDKTTWWNVISGKHKGTKIRLGTNKGPITIKTI
jgi:hypothetical protein